MGDVSLLGFDPRKAELIKPGCYALELGTEPPHPLTRPCDYALKINNSIILIVVSKDLVIFIPSTQYDRRPVHIFTSLIDALRFVYQRYGDTVEKLINEAVRQSSRPI
jgi:hypothetical protein